MIDDDPISLFLTAGVLKRENLTELITSFSNAREALQYLHDHCNDVAQLPDLILVDINMPETNALAFLYELSRLIFYPAYQPKICTISADMNIDLQVFYSVLNVERHFIKPVKSNDLKMLSGAVESETVNFTAVAESVA